MDEDMNLPDETDPTETQPAEPTPHKSESELFEEAFFEGVERKEKLVHVPHVGDEAFGAVEFRPTSEEDQKAFLETEYNKQMENHLKTLGESIQAQHGVDFDTYINNTAETLKNEGYSQEQANQMIFDTLNKGVQFDEKTLADHDILGLMAEFSKDKGRAFGNGLHDHIPKSVFQEAVTKNISLKESYSQHREAQQVKEKAFDEAFLDGFDNYGKIMRRDGVRR